MGTTIHNQYIYANLVPNQKYSSPIPSSQYSNQNTFSPCPQNQYNTFIPPSIADINKSYRENKEYQKNLDEVSFQSSLLEKWSIRSQMPPLPLDKIFMDNLTVPKNIYNEIMYFSNGTIFTPTCASLIFLTAVATSTQGRINIEINKHWHEPLNIFTVQFAEASTKKSLIYDKILHPIKEFENENYVKVDQKSNKARNNFVKEILKKKFNELKDSIDINNLEAIKKSSREYEKFNKEIEESIQISNSSKRILIDNFSKIGLFKFLSENNESCAIISAESDNFFINIKNFDQEILRLYTRESITDDKANKNLILKSPSACISIFAHPDKIDSLYKNDKLIRNGLIARIIPWISNYNYINEENFYYEIKDVYNERIKYLLNRYWGSEREILKLDESAKDYFYKCSSELNNKIYDNQAFKSWVSKLSGNIARLAGAYHVYNNFENPCSSKITLDEIEYGIKIAQNFTETASFLIDPSGYQALQIAKKIFKSYERSDDYTRSKLIDVNHGITTRDIAQRTKLSYKDINIGLKYLEGHNWVCIGDNGSGNLKVIFHPYFYSINRPLILPFS